MLLWSVLLGCLGAVVLIVAGRAREAVREDARSGRRRVAEQDAIWLQDAANNRMVVNALLVTDRMDLDALRQIVNERVVELGQRRPRYPRFTWKLVARGKRWYWQPDAEFRIERHVRLAHAERLRSRKELERFVEAEVQLPLPTDRPPWSLQLLPDVGEGRSGLLFRSHHCMADGLALCAILLSLTDPAELPSGVRTVTRAERRTARGRLLAVLGAVLAAPWVLGRKLLARADRSAAHGPELSGYKHVAWSQPLALERVKRLKDARHATVNDVLLTVVAGGFRRYLTERSDADVERVRAVVPVNLRGVVDGSLLEMGNRFAAALVDLPAQSMVASERLGLVRRQMAALKRSSEPLVMYGTGLLLLKLLPASWSRRLIDFLAAKCSCVLTNVPGPSVPVEIAGRRVHGLMFWVPQRATVGIGISLISYADTLWVGVIADDVVVPEPQWMIDAFEQELRALEAETEAQESKAAPSGRVAA
jgi:hypothetical protein